MNDAIRDRIAGTLVGCAVGDALGAPYEFTIPGPVDPQMIGGGIGPWEPGEWTDDTQLAICIAQAAVAGELTPVGVGERFLEWYRSGPKDMGVQTRAVLAHGHPAVFTEAARESYAARPNSTAGNGSLMRTSPVALAHLGDDAAIVRTARAISSVTHGDPVCGDACVLWCIAIDRAVREQRLDGVLDGITYLPAGSQGQWRAWIEHAYASSPETFVPNGWVVSAFQAALSAATKNNGFTTGLRAAIGAGHDTDTVGAIAGCLLGARYGRAAIPQEWQEPLHGWPGLDADGLAQLAIRVASHA